MVHLKVGPADGKAFATVAASWFITRGCTGPPSKALQTPFPLHVEGGSGNGCVATVNVALVTVPMGVVTLIVPVAALSGTVTLI